VHQILAKKFYGAAIQRILSLTLAACAKNPNFPAWYAINALSLSSILALGLDYPSETTLHKSRLHCSSGYCYSPTTQTVPVTQ